MSFKDMAFRALYNAVLPLGAAAAYCASPLSPKVAQGLRGRRGFEERWKREAPRLAGRCIWFHVSSAGELEQAVPLIESLAPRFPVVTTFFSPSGLSYAQRTGLAEKTAFADYLPLDFKRNVRLCLSLLRTRLLVFVRYDLWPNLLWEARRLRIPSMLIDAVFRRRSLLSMSFHLALYRALDMIVTVSEKDAEAFRAVLPPRVQVACAGETRFDRVEQRRNDERGSFLPVDGKIVLLAGSTHEEDEALLVPAIERLLAAHENLAVAIVPHDPCPERIQGLLRRCKDLRTSPVAMDPRGRRVFLVDRMGVLAGLYREAHVAYVGGGFGAGVHSVLEPAVMGIPIVFGPRIEKSGEARELVAEGAARVVHDGGELESTLEELVSNGEARRRMGEKARSYVERRLGATGKILALMEDYRVGGDGQK